MKMGGGEAHFSPLENLDESVATSLRSGLDALTEEVIEAIRAEVPEYSQPLTGSFGHAVRTGVREALVRFVDVAEGGGGTDPEGWRRVYFNLGRGELRQGRTMESLLAAYRVGARVSWRRVAESAEAAGAGPSQLADLAEGIFAYIDELSAISAEGYAAEQAATAGEAERRREHLVHLLLEGAGPGAIEVASAQTGWEPPARAAVVLARESRAGAIATRLGAGVLAATTADGLVCAIVPDPDSPGRGRELGAALRGRTAAIGPTGAVDELPRSAARARLALELAEAGVLDAAAAPVRAAEHLPALLLHQDPELLADHARTELAPLDGLAPNARRRLLETLEAWIAHPGRPTEIGGEIHIHPQTVRYRLRQLREVLGDIDDPERRFSLALALRGDRAASGDPSG
jgi:hypothetical protein